MTESQRIPTILCISTYEKGQLFLKEAARLGASVLLLTVEKLEHADWPRESLTKLVTMPEQLTPEQVLNTVTYLARTNHIDRIVALDEFDLEVAALLREHMRLPGMGESLTRNFRDKLAMRVSAKQKGVPVPEFTGVFNHDDLRAFLHSVPGPWLLKPRTNASAIGIRKIESPDALWPILDELADLQSHYVLERFVPGEIFHVDSIVNGCEVLFSVVHQYGRPPMQVMHEGGVFTTRTVDRGSRDWMELTALNAGLAPSMGMVRGVTHSEYIRAHSDGRYYFLEIAARVGGAFISDLVAASTGVNLWREWARLEVAFARGRSYVPPDHYEEYAGSVICLARTAEPDTSAFEAPEIVHRMKKHHHAGLIVRSPNPERVRQLLENYSAKFAELFLASMPAPEKPTA